MKFAFKTLEVRIGIQGSSTDQKASVSSLCCERVFVI